MNQKALEATIRAVLLECLPAGWALPVIASSQPTGQGREDGIYFFRIGDGKRGWQGRKYRNDGADLLLTESQWAETEYQFSALVEDDINDDDQLLAGDALDVVRSTLSGIVMAQRLTAMGIGVQRPGNILTPAFVNHHNQYDFNPNFSIVFSHRRDITQVVPYTTTITETSITAI